MKSQSKSNTIEGILNDHDFMKKINEAPIIHEYVIKQKGHGISKTSDARNDKATDCAA